MAALAHEAGCYGDGAFGHQHTRERAADVLAYYVDENFRSRSLPVPDCTGAQGPDDVCMALRGDMSDDGWEELAAEEWLNEHAPFEGHWWGWQDGDFGLWSDDSDRETLT